MLLIDQLIATPGLSMPLKTMLQSIVMEVCKCSRKRAPDIAIWANPAARALVTPDRAGAIGVQLSNQSIWIAGSTTIGDWNLFVESTAPSDGEDPILATTNILNAGVDFTPSWDRPHPYQKKISTGNTQTYYQAGLIRYRHSFVAIATKSNVPGGESNVGNLVLMQSFDIGETWSDEWIPLPAPDAIAGVTARWIQGHISEINDEFYIVAQAGYDPYLPTSRYQMYLFRATNIHGTWTFVKKWTGASANDDFIPGGPMVATGTSWLVSYYTGGFNTISVQRSVNRGASWSTIVVPLGVTEGLHAEPVIYLRPGGKLAMWIRRGNLTTEGLYYTESIDDGITWSALQSAVMPAGFRANGPWGVYTPRGDFVFIGRNTSVFFAGERLYVAPPGSLTFTGHTTPGRNYNSYGSGMVLLSDGASAAIVKSVNAKVSDPTNFLHLEFDVIRWGNSEINMSRGNYDNAGLTGIGTIEALLTPLLTAQGIETSGSKTLTVTGTALKGGGAGSGYRPANQFMAIADQILIGAAADWTFLHNGLTDWAMALNIFLPSGFTGPSSYFYVACTNNGPASNPGISFRAKGDRWELHFANGVSSTIFSSFTLLPGQWNHLVIAVKANQNIISYTDDFGEVFPYEVNTGLASFSESTANPVSGLRIGDVPTWGPAFAGVQIADFVIVRATPTAQIIKRLWAHINRKTLY